MAIDKQIAEEILAQLGGRRFAVMTGAKSFVAIESGLQFKLPPGAVQGINCVRVVLNGDDLYDVSYIKVSGLASAEVARDECLYAEDLARSFLDATGLYTSLGQAR